MEKRFFSFIDLLIFQSLSISISRKSMRKKEREKAIFLLFKLFLISTAGWSINTKILQQEV